MMNERANEPNIFYSGVKQHIRAQAGITLMIHKKIQNTIADYTFWNERIIQIRLKISRGYLTVIRIYAPIEGEEDESTFYNKLQQTLNKIDKSDFIMIMGDFNAGIGKTKIEQNIGLFGEETCNRNGSYLIDFVLYNQLKVMNSFFDLIKIIINLLGN